MSKMGVYFHILKYLKNSQCKIKAIILEDEDWYELREDFITNKSYGNESRPRENPLRAAGNVYLDNVEFKSVSQMNFLEDINRWDKHWEDGFAVGWNDAFEWAENHSKRKKGKKKCL